MLVLRVDIMKKICSHAQNEYPKECCGILLGQRMREQRIAYKVIQTKNMTESHQNTTHFSMDPLELLKVESIAEEEKLEIVGFYHSHPDYEAVVSNADMLHMIQEYSYPIISVKNGLCVNVNSFEIKTQDGPYIKEEILVKEK